MAISEILASKAKPMDYVTIGKLRGVVNAAVAWPTHLVVDHALRPDIRD